METEYFSETLMSTYVSTRRHNPEGKHRNQMIFSVWTRNALVSPVSCSPNPVRLLVVFDFGTLKLRHREESGQSWRLSIYKGKTTECDMWINFLE
jgi:hypothetical protein